MWFFGLTAAEEPRLIVLDECERALCPLLEAPQSILGHTEAAPDFSAHINRAFRLSFQSLSCPAPLGLLWAVFGGRESVLECGFSLVRLSRVAQNRRFYVSRTKRRSHLG